MSARRPTSRSDSSPNIEEGQKSLEKDLPSAERASISTSWARGFVRVVKRAPMVGAILGALALAIAVEIVLLNVFVTESQINSIDGSSPGRDQPCTAVRDCGGFHHRFALVMLWMAATYLWLRKDVLNAAHVSKTLFWLVVLLLALRHGLRVQPGASLPTIKRAFIVSIDGRHHEQLSGLLDASFPEANIPVIWQPSPREIGSLGEDRVKSADLILPQRDSTRAHMAVLESISKAETMALRDTHNGVKEWFLVLEENAVLALSTSPTSSSSSKVLDASSPPSLIAPPDLAATLQGLLAQLPKRAQAVNLGPCRGQVPTFTGFGEKACGILGWDALNFASGLVSAPLVVPLAQLAAEGRDKLRGEDASNIARPFKSDSEGAGVKAELHKRSLKLEEKSEKDEKENDKDIGPLPPSSSIAVYRGFGMCRHAYAVTPAGARWMLEVLLNHELTRREEESSSSSANKMEGQEKEEEDGNVQIPGRDQISSMSSSSNNYQAIPGDVSPSGALRKLWLSGHAMDEAVANAAVRDYRHHQTYFTRLFGKAEWAGCGAGFR